VSTRIGEALGRIERFAGDAVRNGREFAETNACAFAFALARTTAALSMAEYAAWTGGTGSHAAATAAVRRWCERDLARLENAEGPVPSPMLIG
jgi:hypothetical protein